MLHNSPKLALIAGSGDLPRYIIQQCQIAQRNLVVVAFHGQTDPELVQNIDHFWTNLGAVGHTLSELKKRNVQEIVIAGGIKRPSWSELNLDWAGTKFLMRAGVKSLGDDGLLSAVITLLEEHGFHLITPDQFIQNLMARPGVISEITPEEEDIQDIRYGIQILKALGPLDVGQAVVIQRNIVLGIEAIEGTAQLLERCKYLKRTGPGGVLVKIAKPNQSLKVDLPTIGPETINQAFEAGLKGIAIEADKTQVLNLEQTIHLVNELCLFLIGVKSENF
jgi:UDP-2,3-diacylglucosamine hydrolase